MTKKGRKCQHKTEKDEKRKKVKKKEKQKEKNIKKNLKRNGSIGGRSRSELERWVGFFGKVKIGVGCDFGAHNFVPDF